MDSEKKSPRTARGDLVLAGALLVVAIIGYWSLSANEATWGFDYGRDPGPGFLPKALLLALGGMAVILGGLALWRLRLPAYDRAQGRDMPIWRSLALPALLVVSLMAYVLGSLAIGFIPSTAIFAAVWIVLLGVAEHRRLTALSAFVYAAQAAGIVAAVFLLFVEFIGVPLP